MLNAKLCDFKNEFVAKCNHLLNTFLKPCWIYFLKISCKSLLHTLFKHKCVNKTHSHDFSNTFSAMPCHACSAADPNTVH